MEAVPMYAVIRAGGKQYRVAPGDVVKIEKVEKTSNSDQNIEFEVLAVSGEEGKIAKAEDAKVVGEDPRRGPRRQDSGLSL